MVTTINGSHDTQHRAPGNLGGLPRKGEYVPVQDRGYQRNESVNVLNSKSDSLTLAPVPETFAVDKEYKLEQPPPGREVVTGPRPGESGIRFNLDVFDRIDRFTYERRMADFEALDTSKFNDKAKQDYAFALQTVKDHYSKRYGTRQEYDTAHTSTNKTEGTIQQEKPDKTLGESVSSWFGNLSELQFYGLGFGAILVVFYGMYKFQDSNLYKYGTF